MADRGHATTEANEHERSRIALDGYLSAIQEDRLRIAEQTAYEKAYEKTVHRGKVRWTILTVIGLVVVIGFGAFFIVEDSYARNAFRANLWFVALSAALGAAVGASELVSRYRDDPMRALRTAPALTYIALNALVSGCIYGLITHYAKTMFPALAKDPLMRSITAGFGAMAILRSKFFTVRTAGGEEVGIGPDAAVSAFLSAADRGVDRARAQRRLDLVFRSADRIPRLEDIKDYIKVALLSFQNLTDRDKLNTEIDAIYKNDSFPSSQLKLQATCYRVLVVLGEYNFNKLINNLAALKEIKESSKEELFSKFTQSSSTQPTAAPPPASPPPASNGPGKSRTPKRRPKATPSASDSRTSSKPSPRSPTPKASAPKPASTPKAPPNGKIPADTH
jgi:hypothetical protein